MVLRLVLLIFCLSASPTQATKWVLVTECGGLENLVRGDDSPERLKHEREAFKKVALTLISDGKSFDVAFERPTLEKLEVFNRRHSFYRTVSSWATNVKAPKFSVHIMTSNKLMQVSQAFTFRLDQAGKGVLQWVSHNRIEGWFARVRRGKCAKPAPL